MAKKITGDTEFPRSWTDVTPEGTEISFTAQPYTTSGLYIAGSSQGRSVIQTGCTWGNLGKLVKSLEKSSTITNLNKRPLKDFLTTEEIENYLN